MSTKQELDNIRMAITCLQGVERRLMLQSSETQLHSAKELLDPHREGMDNDFDPEWAKELLSQPFATGFGVITFYNRPDRDRDYRTVSEGALQHLHLTTPPKTDTVTTLLEKLMAVVTSLEEDGYVIQDIHLDGLSRITQATTEGPDTSNDE